MRGFPGDDGGLTEAVASAHGYNSENTDGQVGKSDFQLKGTSGGPAYRLGHRFRKEEVSEKATDTTSGHTNAKEI